MKKHLLAILLILGGATLNINTYAADKIKIVTSFSILQDITQNIAGDHAEVKTIVPANTDAHSYNLTPKNMVDIEKAETLIISGLGFEGFLERYLKSSKYSSKLIVASTGIPTIASQDLDSNEHENNNHNEQEQHHHLGMDPHVWQNPQNGVVYASNIAQVLCQKDPDHCNEYTQNAKSYISKLNELDQKYEKIFASIPTDSRAMITTHDAFNYMATRYNIKVYSPLGLDNNSEATAQKFLSIKNLLSTGCVTAIFLENIANNRIIENIENSTGIKNTATPVLYSDALSTDNTANTYLKLLDYNLGTVSSSMNQD